MKAFFLACSLMALLGITGCARQSAAQQNAFPITFVSPDAQWAVVADFAGHMRLQQTSGNEIRTFSSDYSWFQAPYLWSQDATKFVLVNHGYDAQQASIEIWNPSQDQPQVLSGISMVYGPLLFSPNGRYLTVQSSANSQVSLTVWDTQEASNATQIIYPSSQFVSQVAWIDNTTLFVVIRNLTHIPETEELYLLNVQTGSSRRLNVFYEGSLAFGKAAIAPYATENGILVIAQRLQSQYRLCLLDTRKGIMTVSSLLPTGRAWSIAWGGPKSVFPWRVTSSGAEVLCYHLDQQTLGSLHRFNTPSWISADQTGRLWTWSGNKLVNLGKVED